MANQNLTCARCPATWPVASGEYMVRARRKAQGRGWRRRLVAGRLQDICDACEAAVAPYMGDPKKTKG